MNLQKKLANLLATTKRKRPYYCEVEYLETTGTQYINTGFPFHFSEDTVTLRAELTQLNQYQTVYGVNEIFDGTTQFFGVRQLSTEEKWQGLGVSITYPAFTLNKQFTLQISRIDETFFQYKGEEANIGSTNNLIDTTLNGFIFSTDNNGQSAFNCIGKIYSFQQKRAGILIRDLIPVLDWDMTPCMYDKVSNDLLYNAGTGKFSCGREIHRVEYLESTGTQYIDTGYKPLSISTVEISVSALEFVSGNCLFGNVGSQSASLIRLLIYNDATRGQILSLQAQSYGVKTDGFIPFDNDFHKYTITPTAASIDDTYTYSATRADSDKNLFLFTFVNASNTYYNSSARIKYCKISEDGVLVHDFIPAVDENGVGFMFDRVSHTIFDNAGTDAFSYPPAELEYIELTGTQYIDTGIKSTDLTSFDIVFIPSENTQSYQVYLSSETNGTFTFGESTSDITSVYLRYGGDKTLFATGLISSTNQNRAYINNNKEFIVNETNCGSITLDVLGTVDENVYIGHSSITHRDGKFKIYGLKLYTSVLVRNLIPALKDGQLGMWDKVNEVFYPNLGTGTFIRGKVKNK